VEKSIVSIVALMLVLLGCYTMFLGWLAYVEPAKFRNAPALSESAREAGAFYRTEGAADGAFLNPERYPEIQGALQYQVSREKKDDAGDGWTQTAVVEAARIEAVTLGTVPVVITHATRILAEPKEVIRPIEGAERLKLAWTPGAGRTFAAYGTFDGERLGDGRFDRVYLASLSGEKELLELMEQSAGIKALVLGFVGVVSLVMAAFAVRSAFR
jgi:hypothetical protein